MNSLYTDIAVLGGGAAGLAAAIHGARASKGSVIILEKNQRLGKKLINTGNGRCNLSHSPISLSHYHGDIELLSEVFSKTMNSEDFFLSLGLKCRRDSFGNLYPYSNTAASVIDALRLEMEKYHIEELTLYNAVRIEPLLEGFRIFPTDKEQPIVNARRLIISTGGKSAPATGSDGSIFQLLKKLGIKISPLSPSLCPIKTKDNLIRPMKGIRVYAAVSAISDGKVLGSETGEVQFGDGVLSGICMFNLSRFAALDKKELFISVDFTPDLPLEELMEFIEVTSDIRKNAPIEDFLSGLLPKRVAVTLLKQITSLPMNKKVKDLSAEEMESLALIIKDYRFPALINPDPWKYSQVTAGGVLASELLPNLSSKKFPHLYFAGEVVNIDGDCGGYNLNWCWRSGELAGKSAGESL